MAMADRLHYRFYEDGLPAEVEGELEHLYGTPFAVASHFRIFRAIETFQAVRISAEGAGALQVVAYLISGSELTVLNELVGIGTEYLDGLADAIFDRYPGVRVININRLYADHITLQHPLRLWQRSQDIVVKLPAEVESYRAGLGKQTRKHLQYYQNRLQREAGDISFSFDGPPATDRAAIATIIALNRRRMQDKQIRSVFDSVLEEKVADFCSRYGRIGTLCVGGRIIAGTICYEVGEEVYLEAVSHDPAFDRYNPGQLCLFLTIKSAIERGKRSFHMLWGENQYKYRFLGERRELRSFSIYRSRSAKLLDLPRLAGHLYRRGVDQWAYLRRTYISSRLQRKP